MGADLIAEDNPAFCGRPGVLGQRAANIVQQKADEIRVFGARMDGEQVFYNYSRFAPNAKRKLFTDVDLMECARMKEEGWEVSPLNLSTSLQPPYEDPYHLDGHWLAWCRALYCRFRGELEGADSGKYVDPFMLMRLIEEHSLPSDVFAIGSSGNAPTAFFQSFKVKAGQRIHNVCTIGAMGADIPMALGSAVASGRRTICVTGDGGFQLNAQELETIRRLNLPITFFVLNNNGYASIRNNQKLRFGRVMGADPKSGLTLPPLENLADGYRLVYQRLEGKDLHRFGRCFDFAPKIVEVMCDPDWVQYPRAMAHMQDDGSFVNDDMADMTPKIDDLDELMGWDG
jgi:acetolactate synthase-1/2/3 large subunit